MKKIVLYSFILLYSFSHSMDIGYDFHISEPTFRTIVFIPLKSFLIKETRELKVFKEKNDYLFGVNFFSNNLITDIYKPDLTKYYFMLLLKREKEESGTLSVSKEPIQVFPKDKKIKVRFIFDAVVDNVQDDVESYAEVYLNKKNIGITEQKLLSQEKNFEFETTYEKHLLQIVIFVQDPLKKRWVRLKNIDQPKPIYFTPNVSYENLYIKLTYYPNREGSNRYSFTGSFLIDKRD